MSGMHTTEDVSITFEIHSINVSMYLCNCNQTASNCDVHTTHHMLWVPTGIYIYIYIYIYVCVCSYCCLYTSRHDTGKMGDDVSGKPHR